MNARSNHELLSLAYIALQIIDRSNVRLDFSGQLFAVLLECFQLLPQVLLNLPLSVNALAEFFFPLVEPFFPVGRPFIKSDPNHAYVHVVRQLEFEKVQEKRHNNVKGSKGDAGITCGTTCTSLASLAVVLDCDGTREQV